ncbi:PepSY domain-containing protein [Cellulomonas fimi]|uniref:Peptidase M4 n=1 Tax=Cellulomonas fimi TaxID=1708 RepID=A0A7Y0M1A1_CELFI|nr:PepSY domain-containing protein [Cellulomonas fimi]NMR21223.1 peptidase M4 [Cellulomonas fimi]
MNSTTKRTVAVGALVTGLAMGGAGIAMAASDPAPARAPGASTAANPNAGSGTEENEAPGTEQDDATEDEDGAQDPSFTGTVPAPPDGEDGTETDDDAAGEAQEARVLEPLATTTAQEAAAAATAAVPGTAGAVELENENGYVVYNVEVSSPDGTTVQVKVDAGNGSVLAQEADNDTETNDG